MYKPSDDKTFENWPGSPSAELNRESWKVFQVMGEFVEGFDKMAHVHPAVSIFGSARTQPDHAYYKLTEAIAKKLSDSGFSIISGGGPGIMEAANKGAQQGRSPSIGLNIILPGKQETPNDYQDVSINFHHFFVRKTMFIKYSAAYIVMPGGFGTLDEVLECLTLIQTDKTPAIPVILVQSDFWKGMLDFFKNTLAAEGTINPDDIDLMQVLDTPDEICEAIFDFYADKGFHRPDGQLGLNINQSLKK
ncbi:MAG: TIGR00730 family Rossman fold protein [Arenicellales bacterium]